MYQFNDYTWDQIDAGEQANDSLFSQYVRVMRLKHNLSRLELASLVDIDPQRLAALENGWLARVDFSTDEHERFEGNFALSYQSFVKLLLDQGLSVDSSV